MNKKYFPLITLLAALLFFYWVRTNQRGKQKDTKHRTEVVPPSNKISDAGFDRNPSKIIYSKHAKCRMDCRHIDEREVKEILAEGILNEAKIETSARGTSYPLEGTTHDGQRVRIVFAPKEDGSTVVVTVIDLDTEFKCSCN